MRGIEFDSSCGFRVSVNCMDTVRVSPRMTRACVSQVMVLKFPALALHWMIMHYINIPQLADHFKELRTDTK